MRLVGFKLSSSFVSLAPTNNQFKMKLKSQETFQRNFVLLSAKPTTTGEYAKYILWNFLISG